MSEPQIILMTDLDGTLLDHDTFGYESVKSFMVELIHAGIKIIPNSSKTSVELEYFCKDFDAPLAYVCENGAAIHHLAVVKGQASEAFIDPIVLGKPVSVLMDHWTGCLSPQLRELCVFLDDLSRVDQAKILGLRGEALDRAMSREYSRPFVFKGSEDTFHRIQDEAKKFDLNVVRGGRVSQLSGYHDKADSISIVRQTVSSGPKNALIIALGDGENDINMLCHADIACVIPSKNGEILSFDTNRSFQKIIHASKPAPHGWLEAVEAALELISIESRNCYG